MKKVTLAFGLIMISAMPWMASAKHYGTAGCGLGSLVFKDQPGLIQVVAVTLNGTGVQTFGITTGTSNCHEHGKRGEYAMFIQINQKNLLSDMARGEGQSLDALSELLGCNGSNAVSKDLQGKVETVYPSTETTAAEMGENIKEILKSSEASRGQCGHLADIV